MGARLARQLKLMKSTIVGECVPGTCGEPSRDLTTNTFQLNAHGRFLDTSAFLVRDMGTGARINDGVAKLSSMAFAGRQDAGACAGTGVAGWHGTGSTGCSGMGGR